MVRAAAGTFRVPQGKILNIARQPFIREEFNWSYFVECVGKSWEIYYPIHASGDAINLT